MQKIYGTKWHKKLFKVQKILLLHKDKEEKIIKKKS